MNRNDYNSINRVKDFIGFVKNKVKVILQDTAIDQNYYPDDRRILEKEIFPHFQNNDKFQTIIFIGVARYTKPYNKVFKKKKYWTIDIDPKAKKFGSQRHIIDSMENLPKYFQKSEVDIIFCNGVFGWGLNNRENIEAAFNACFDLLRKGGVFILGWNDIQKYRPILLEDVQALKLFEPLLFEPLGTDIILTKNPNRHTYNFYFKS